MAEAQEHGGLWWLPSRPEQQVPGVLTIDESGRSHLTLIGELRSPEEEAEQVERTDGVAEYQVTASSLDAGGNYPRVLGRVGVTMYTLLDGIRTNHSYNLFGGVPSETVIFTQVLRGGLWF